MAKVFAYKGKTLDELKKISDKELTGLLQARQRRSLERGFTNAQKIMIKKVDASIAGIYKKQIKTHCRDLIILPRMEGMKVGVYSGKEFVDILIMPEMIGHCLGEFVLTRKRVQHSAAGIGATKSSKAISAK